MLRVEEVTSAADFESLQSAWQSLLERSDRNTPFLSHDWFRCALSAYGEKKKACILLVRSDTGIAGVAPLWQSQVVVRGVPVRRIEFISTPDTAMADFIVQQDRRQEVLAAFLGHLYHQRSATWDVLTLSQWPADSANLTAFQDLLLKQRRRLSTSSSSTVPYIAIKDTWEAFLHTRSARFRKTQRNIINRIERLGNADIQCHRHDGNGRVLDDVLAVAKKSWKDHEGVAIANRPETRRFFEDLTSVASRNGWLLVWLLRVDGAPIAMEYDLEFQGKVYALRADFDEAYRDCSPGAYVEFEILKRLFDKGYTEYSFGPGLNTYKLQWTEERYQNVVLHLYNETLKGRLIWNLETKLLPVLRHIKTFAAPLVRRKC